MSNLVGDLAFGRRSAPEAATALVAGTQRVDYDALRGVVEDFALALVSLGVSRDARVGVWLEKRLETVAAMFGTARAGRVFVPVNPLLKPAQAAYIALDCNLEVLITTDARWASMRTIASECPDLRHVVLVGSERIERGEGAVAQLSWGELLAVRSNRARLRKPIDVDMAAILYTSGSTGRPKGVVVSHRNIVEGARSVSTYLQNGPSDRILAVLPLSFDYGLSQLTTSFLVGATVVLHNDLLPQDVVRVLEREQITGLAAVPPLWIQLAALQWPQGASEHLRYFTNSGGAMPTATLIELRKRAPKAKPFLMYGLTEAFRSTYLPPEEVDRRPTSMGKAIPNAEILVVREDGSECAPGEPGELVHRGALVSLGYWNDLEKTAERFRPLPGQRKELVLTELAVWSGDTVRKDEEGFLYFIGRRDEMIKTSGYRVSPTEIEEVVYRSGLAAEAAAFGVEHPALGQAIVLVVKPALGQEPDSKALLDACKGELPTFMLPQHIDWVDAALPRNANGKIDRKALAAERIELFASAAPDA